MRKSRILVPDDSFSAEFARCCREYDTLSIAVAWCGNPDKTLPYKFLENFSGKIKAIVGISFRHTHPDAIEWFMNIDSDILIYNEDADLFHPKIYLFGNRQRYALFVGSSNFTFGGFHKNVEFNCLIEGASSSETSDDIALLEDMFSKWCAPEFSFKPTVQWLKKYRQRYEKTLKDHQKLGLRTPPSAEDAFSTAGWLQHADWDIYYKKVQSSKSNLQHYHDVLNAADLELPLPWKTNYFQDINKRRIMGGMAPYGSLGNVSASGRVRQLLKNGTHQEWATIVKSINTIAAFNQPIPWAQFKSHLDLLTTLGPSIKVWGRFLSLVRPDLYCTISSASVRENLSQALGITQKEFEGVDGYIKLIKLIHSSPWFNTIKPKNKIQADIWSRRAAFLDAIFY